MATVSKQQVSEVFKRLRAIPTNKACFDCQTSDPSWASLSYGVFLCMQCSGIHRSLGVHLSFIRSTRLDSWTWIQLRAMQVGGNAQATAFFRQHGCTSINHGIKYNSRAAALYREKLAGMAERAHQKYGVDKLYVSAGPEDFGTPATEDDFFDQFEPESPLAVAFPKKETDKEGGEMSLGPQVSLSDAGPNLSKSAGGKSSIGQRIPASSKKKLGVKKGLGAQKVAADFQQAEQKASAAEKRQEQEKRDEERLATTLGVETQKREQAARKIDPKKADQLDRLGMGASGMRTVSHSASAAMNTIDQVKPVRESSKAMRTLGMSSSSSSSSSGRRERDEGGFFDSFGVSEPKPYVDEPSRYDRDFDNDGWGLPKYEGSNLSDVKRSSGSKRSSEESSKRSFSRPSEPASSANDRFSSSKGISSDQYFGRDSGSSREHGGGVSMDKFSGASSISSDDFFGDTQDQRRGGSHSDSFSLRNEVSRVTGKLSTMASGVIGSLKDRYGRQT